MGGERPASPVRDRDWSFRSPHRALWVLVASGTLTVFAAAAVGAGLGLVGVAGRALAR